MNWPAQFNLMQFSEGGRQYIFAAGSLFLFEIDELTAKVLEKAATHTPSQILSELTPFYSVDEVKQVFNEIDCLAEAGILSLCNQSQYIHALDPNLPQIEENPSFRELWLILTHSCNLACKYCFSTIEYMHQGHAMTEDVARRGVDFLLRHSDGHYRLRIIFFGGEPLLEFSLMKAIVAYARQKAIGAGKEVSFAITTNGTLLNQEVRLFLVENNFNTLVSLDGPQPMHDAARQFRDGRGSFQRIVPQVKALVREAAAVGVGIQGRTTLNRHHLGYVPELYEFMDRQMGFSGVSTPMVHRPAPAEFSFIEADLPQLKEDLARLGDLVVEKASLEGTPPAYGLFAFLDVLHQRSRPRRGCAAGRLAVTVDCNGKIYPCERFIGQENCCLGSVFSEEFRRDRIEWLSNQDRICAFDKCHKCYAMLYCKSTCVAERLLYLDKTGPTELDCEIYRTILLQILSVYVRVYYHPADGTCKRSQ